MRLTKALAPQCSSRYSMVSIIEEWPSQVSPYNKGLEEHLWRFRQIRRLVDLRSTSAPLHVARTQVVTAALKLESLQRQAASLGGQLVAPSFSAMQVAWTK